MTADMSGEQMQAKITAARREAEGLKDRIKRRKDELADASRTGSPSPSLSLFFLFTPVVGIEWWSAWSVDEDWTLDSSD